MDGVPGPGVGADVTVIQAGPVGRLRLALVAVTCVVGKGELPQEGNRNERRITINVDECAVFRMLGYGRVCCNSSKDVIQAIVLTNSASESLCSRRARTAGPTGSSPAAPPGTSA